MFKNMLNLLHTNGVCWGYRRLWKNPKHKNKEDLISAIITLGDESIVGGDTIYFNDSNGNERSNITNTTYVQHGQEQIGFFNDAYRVATPWNNGSRIIINFNLKRNVLKNFITRGHDKHEAYKKTGYEKHYVVK